MRADQKRPIIRDLKTANLMDEERQKKEARLMELEQLAKSNAFRNLEIPDFLDDEEVVEFLALWKEVEGTCFYCGESPKDCECPTD